MRVIVIGGTGRVGTYLVPQLVDAGHEVLCVARGEQSPRQTHAAWERVQHVSIDRDAAEAQGTFGEQLAELRPEAVIDMICFNARSARQLIDGLGDRIALLAVCGTAWVYGHSVIVPTPETFPRHPICAYGRDKAEMETVLLDAAKTDACPTSVLHAGHIVSPSDRAINPQGNKNPEVFAMLARGEPRSVPHHGPLRGDLAWICRRSRRLVRSRCGPAFPTLRYLARDARPQMGPTDLGPPRPQPQRLDSKGPRAAGLCPRIRQFSGRTRGR